MSSLNAQTNQSEQARDYYSHVTLIDPSAHDVLEIDAEQPVRCKAPGTCGELVQGAVNGQDFLVNCPIDLYSHAQVRRGHTSGIQVFNAENYQKISDGIEMLAIPDSLASRLELLIDSDIPRGKGMASSSADLAAALTLVCESCRISLSPSDLSKLIAAVEPSDCVHLPGIAHVNHLSGQVHSCLPAPFDMSVVVTDCGGEIDTVGLDREYARGIYRKERHKITSALSMLIQGLVDNNPYIVATAATMSAEVSQLILPKNPLEELHRCTRKAGALGINCAHSGTVLGVLYRTSDGIGDKLVDVITATFGCELQVLGCHRIISGGCHGY